MIQIPNTNLFIGGIHDFYALNNFGWAFVHATQTIHYRKMGWDRKYNKPNKAHSNYIVLDRENFISLNWVDGEARLYEWSRPETFVKVLDFIDRQIKSKKILVHCDQGVSRAPTIGLLFLAKRAKLISNDSFDSAMKDFLKIYPKYQPSGIGEYVRREWNNIA